MATIGKLLMRQPVHAQFFPQGTQAAVRFVEVMGEKCYLWFEDEDKLWRVNTNGDRYFKGRMVRTTSTLKNGWKTHLTNQWIADWVEPSSRQPTTEPFALVAGKHTEIARIEPQFVPYELNADMFGNSQAVGGIRSAYFSAAFLLQLVLANLLDIDSAEVDIADII